MELLELSIRQVHLPAHHVCTLNQGAHTSQSTADTAMGSHQP